MTDASELMWSYAATDHAAEQTLRRYTLAKVAAQQVCWSFLAAAQTPAEYTARYDLVEDRVIAAVDTVSEQDTALLDQVKTSLQEDHELLQAGRKQARIHQIAADWADESGPLHTLASTGQHDDKVFVEISSVAASTFDPADRRELAELVVALGGRVNFPVEITALVVDPSDVQHEFNQDAYDAGRADGRTDNNAGLQQYQGHPDYQSGLEAGYGDSQDEQMNPDLYNGNSEPNDLFESALHTAESHAPYWVRPKDGQYVVVNALGEVKGTHPSRAQALAQQSALYASVPDAAEKAKERHSDPMPDKVKNASVVIANQYIREESPGDWVITQKGTGDILSHHTSEEKAEAAFAAMESNMHSGMKWGYLDREGAFHEVAVNEDAFGADRYEHVDAPPTPAWIHDEYTDHKVNQPGENQMVNNADGNELKPNAPYLVAEEMLRRADSSNPFSFSGPGNPDSTQSPMATQPPAPPDDPSQVGADPSALGGAAADGTNLAPMPTPADDPSQGEDVSGDAPASVSSSLYTAPVDSKINQIAASVLASNPGMPLRICLALAERAVTAHPEMIG